MICSLNKGRALMELSCHLGHLVCGARETICKIVCVDSILVMYSMRIARKFCASSEFVNGVVFLQRVTLSDSKSAMKNSIVFIQ